jgi:hypothetical protein
MHESFLVYRRFFYLKISLALMLLSIAAYALHTPPVPPNGGTWLGYTLGTVGALLIFWLLGFGIRKRQYSSELGTLRGWLSGHVYLGASLLVIATLHSGFQFGWNVHTLAYTLMVIVILSGFVGVYTYIRYPTLLTENREGRSDASMLSEIADLDQQSIAIASKLGDSVHQIILRSIERTRFDGKQLKKSEADLSGTLTELKTSLTKGSPAQGQPEIEGKSESTILFVAKQIVGMGGDPEKAKLISQLLDLVSAKKALIEKLRWDIRYHAFMKEWLSIHIPLSIMLLVALLIHIISVFFYW